jgi:hypothetical protein
VPIPLTERYILPLPLPVPWDVFGQAVTFGQEAGTPGFTLISALTEPLPVDSRLDYVLLGHEEADEFIWSFSDPGNGTIAKTVRGDAVASFTARVPGPLLTEIAVQRAGRTIASKSFVQECVAPSMKFESLLFDLRAAKQNSDMFFALREICEELQPYIVAAAESTGANGIPARLLAAVLFMEAWGRPKDGSPKALSIRKRLSGEEYNPRIQAIEEMAKRFVGKRVSKLHLHDIREEEVALIRSFFNEFETLDNYDPRKLEILFAGKKTLGVGQIAQTTTAMTEELIAWRDLNEGSRAADLEAIETAYKALSLTDLLTIFNSLRFPKMNVMVAAHLLAKIKNRPNRFPTMSARALLASEQGIGIIATEYNRGAYGTPLTSTKNNGNGDRAVKYVLSTKDVIGLTRFFPDPP